MRMLATLLCVQVLVCVNSVAGAEPPATELITLLKDLCVSPSEPEAMIGAGEQRAAASGWRLIKSGPMPLPMMHNENGPPMSFGNGWELDLSEGVHAQLMMSIVRPAL